MKKASNLRKLYPLMEPNRTGFLQVSDLHEIYYEESGRIDGVPAIALHGGPGGGSSPDMRRYFDLSKYRLTLFDQRGAGKSRPASELKDNTTWDLVEDMEALRKHLGVDKWVVMGGSWGSTLALSYAIKYPERVRALILRGIFMLRHKEIQWFYQTGADRIFPDAYERYVSVIPEDERGDLLSAFYKRLTSDDSKIRAEAAYAWARWEGETLSIKGPAALPQRFDDADFLDAFARIECHYFMNKGFYENDSWILDNIKTIAHIPGTIIHGRYDVVTPVENAWELHKAWPQSELYIIPDAGHSSMEPGIIDQLVKAADKYACEFMDD